MHVSPNPGENVARRRQLQDRYAFLRATSIQNGLMAFGFECGDGWLPILNAISRIPGTCGQGRHRRQVPCHPGQAEVRTLRSTTTAGGIQALVQKAEALSAVTCEVCGQQGTMRDDFWVSVRCDRCYKKI
jgi:hypothetical protein